MIVPVMAWNRKQLEIARTKLPEELHDVPLRYVEALSHLSQESLQALADAWERSEGGLNIGRAIEYLATHLVINVEDLVSQSATLKAGRPPKNYPLSVASSEDDFRTVVEILKLCYPGMQSEAANALARSQAMQEVVAVVASVRIATESQNAKADFVKKVLAHLFRNMEEKINFLE